MALPEQAAKQAPLMDKTSCLAMGALMVVAATAPAARPVGACEGAALCWYVVSPAPPAPFSLCTGLLAQAAAAHQPIAAT